MPELLGDPTHALPRGQGKACVGVPRVVKPEPPDGLPGHPPSRIKDNYREWAARIFEKVPSRSPRLRRPVSFWCKAWRTGGAGIWRDIGPTPLAFLESLLIGVAGLASPDTLLNREGINRR